MEFSPTTTPSFEQYQHNQAALGFGHSTSAQRRDWYDSWASMYYPNMYQAEMLNYQNEYDKPLNQMLRWQQAGLNPYNFQSMQGASGNQGAALKQQTGNQDVKQKQIANVINGISSLAGAARAAKEIYDYMNYGSKISWANSQIASFNVDAASARADQAAAESAWTQYWNYGQDMDNGSGFMVSQSPRARYMESSTQKIQAQISQLNSMVNDLYPSQKQANEARAALMEYETEILKGNNDAILNINTGNATADAVLKLIAYWIKQNAMSAIVAGISK